MPPYPLTPSPPHPLPVQPASRFLEQEKASLSTGLPEVDRLLGGGLPRGRMTEIAGGLSAGKTGLLFSILAQATRAGEGAAYIDAHDALAPEFAQRAGVDLTRLLWIRCRHAQSRTRLQRALQAADLLSQAGGFGLIVLDLVPPGLQHRGSDTIPASSWFRLQRALKGRPAALLILSTHSRAGSAASRLLLLERTRTEWRRTQHLADRHNCLLQGFESRICLSRGGRDHVQVYSHF